MNGHLTSREIAEFVACEANAAREEHVRECRRAVPR